MDAADTFRMTADPQKVALALDYSNFDKHMTIHNFRAPMRQGLLRATQSYPKTDEYIYDGVPLSDLVAAGYGPGRAEGTLWDGNRHVIRITRDVYDSLPHSVLHVERDEALFRAPPGVIGIRTLDGLEHDPKGDVLVCPVDGSDLARVYTHLSGENSTLVMNTLHNMAIGQVVQEQLQLRAPGVVQVSSEMYVGDDTLMYLDFQTMAPHKMDTVVDIIFDTVAKCGHEASPAKTTLCALSTEKTQTHAKQGVYVPQDRMMIISSEREKNIEDLGSYMRSAVAVMATKVSRGFSHRLAVDILLFKASLLGYRKFKNIVFGEEGFRLRDLVSDAGHSTVVVRDPFTLYVPQRWGGYGVFPTAINIVATEALLLEAMTWREFAPYKELYINFSRRKTLPLWNEAHPDASTLDVKVDTSAFHRFVRPAVAHALSVPSIGAAVDLLPLGRFSPRRLKDTMIRDALLKEPRARAILSTSYEVSYLKDLLAMRPGADLNFALKDGTMLVNYVSVFTYEYQSLQTRQPVVYPDVNLSLPFLLQRVVLGVRQSQRLRLAYTDQIENILRGDGIMRGLITANDILTVLQDFPGVSDVASLTYLLSLLNLQERVAMRLATFLLSGTMRLDATSLNRDGVGGDEFTMSLGICDEQMQLRAVHYPDILTDTETLAISLHVGQLLMAKATLGDPQGAIRVGISNDFLTIFKKLRRGVLTKRHTKVQGVKNLLQQYVRSDYYNVQLARLEALPF
nr:MAG: RNA-dependent RNA polymerase [Reoviridae sp.]